MFLKNNYKFSITPSSPLLRRFPHPFLCSFTCPFYWVQWKAQAEEGGAPSSLDMCSCFYSNFMINFWIHINFIGVYQTILLLHLRRMMMLMRDSKCKQWRIQRRDRWGKSRWWRALWAKYSWILIFLLTLRLSKYMSKNHMEVFSPLWCFKTLSKH